MLLVALISSTTCTSTLFLLKHNSFLLYNDLPVKLASSPAVNVATMIKGCKFHHTL